MTKKLLLTLTLFLLVSRATAGIFPTIFLKDSATRDWVAVCIYDLTADSWENYYYRNPQMLINEHPMESGRWYWVGLWDYNAAKWTYSTWVGSFVDVDEVSPTASPAWFNSWLD